MTVTDTYKLERIGLWWHIMRKHKVGWWIFARTVWLSEFPYYWFLHEAKEAYKEITNTKNDKGYIKYTTRPR